MSVFERLARPLAHGVDLGAVARSTLKHGEPLDVEWLMAGLPRFQEAIVRAKYQLDSQARHEAWAYWFIRLMEFGWDTTHCRGVVDRMATDTLNYWISPRICKRCGGVGELTIDTKVISCEACEGTGRRDPKPHTVMRNLGFGPGSVRPVWIERHRSVLAMLDREEAEAATHMIGKLIAR